MTDIILVFVCFIGGLFVGLVRTVDISNNNLLEASAMCAVNGDLLKIEADIFGYKAICGNGAEFKLKEK